MKKCSRSCLLILALIANFAAYGANETRVRIVDDVAQYRIIQIDVNVASNDSVAAYEVWYAQSPFQSTAEATLHSQIRVGDTSSLPRVAIGESYDDCWTDGLPVHRDPFGMPVIDRASRQWSCSLTGMLPGRNYWIAVVPVDTNNRALIDGANLEPVQGRTDVADVLSAPADTRLVLTALSSIVITLAALFIFLRWRDLREGNSDARLAHLYVAPALIALAVLSFYPVVYGIWLSFTDANQSHLGEESFIGLANFVEVFGSNGLVRVTLFTIIWSLANVCFHVGFGLMLASVLTRPGLKGKLFYRTVLLLPWAIPGYISILAWRGLLGSDGLINSILGTHIDFLSQVTSAQVLVIVTNIWLGVPFMMMSLSGALMAIPQDMYEAARLDGVSRWRQFAYLTVPSLKNTLVPLSLLGFIWSFNMFTVIFLMTRGNPVVGFGEPGATDILITYVYDLAFEYGRYGVAAAWSVVIFLMLLVFSWIYMKKTRATESVS